MTLLRSTRLRRLALSTIILLAPFAHAHERAPDQTPIHFRHGSRAETIHASVTGYQQANFVFDGSERERWDINLDHPGRFALHYNVVSPSGKTIFLGSAEGNRFKQRLKETGQYEIRAYLMRADARRSAHADFTLRLKKSQGKP